MKLIIRYLNLCVLIIFSFLFFQDLLAQSFEETVRFADNLYLSGNLNSALKSYQRAIFFSEGRNIQYLYRQIAEISLSKKDYEDAQKYFGLALNQTEDDSLKTELLFDKASCQILNHNFQFGIIDLFSITDTSKAVQKRLNFYLATCYFGLEDFNTSQTYFESCIEIKYKKELSALFSEKNLQSPSPKKARILSMIIPGLGQTYSGDLKSGLNSLLLSAGLITLSVNITMRYHPIDAIVTILPWYQRYYTGGYYKAEEIARKKRALNRNETYNEILKFVDETPNCNN